MKDYANYVYDASNRLTAIQNTGGSTLHTLSYDVQGNVTAKDTASYTFDYGNRLRLGTGPGGSEGYRYDGHGRRALAWVPAGATLSFYAFNGQLLYQHSTPKARALDHIYLAGSLVAIREAPFAGGSEVKYQHTDALGSPVAISNAAGTVTERTNYDPYGGAINKTVDGVGYTGHVMDPVTGLTYMQQRYYDPGMGAFLSVDPVASRVEGDNFNRYWYANSNPYKWLDPDGRDSYLASRPLRKTDLASHNYIVTGADYVGDPKATIHSFGNRGNGIAGRVNGATLGDSEGTYQADVKHWASLSLGLSSTSATKIAATDAIVEEIANSVLPVSDYAYVPGSPFAAESAVNSNSMASAVANRAQGSEVPVPDGRRVSPGKRQADRVKFKEGTPAPKPKEKY